MKLVLLYSPTSTLFSSQRVFGPTRLQRRLQYGVREGDRQVGNSAARIVIAIVNRMK